MADLSFVSAYFVRHIPHGVRSAPVPDWVKSRFRKNVVWENQ